MAERAKGSETATAENIARNAEDTRASPVGAGAPDVRSVALLFEESAPGRSGADVCGCADGESDGAAILGAELCRDDIPGFPELSEPQVMRHFLRLSQLNFGQALQFYPLGSCTMKYNPRACNAAALLPGFTGRHPLASARSMMGTATSKLFGFSRLAWPPSEKMPTL